jgi:hypothetical protein
MTQFKPKNPDYDARVRNSFDRQKVMNTLGISIAELLPGRIVLEMAHQVALTQQHGFCVPESCRQRWTAPADTRPFR